MKLKEVSYIGVKTFPVGKIGGIRGTRDFDKYNLPKKLELLGISECLPEKFSQIYMKESLGDAFENTINELFEGKGEIALIVEWTVLTLHK